MPLMNTNGHYQKILDTAETFIQLRGYNAFSYRDIADVVGIKTSSIHYHFPAKADLGKMVVRRHIENLSHGLDELLKNEKLSSKKKLELFFDGMFSKTYLNGEKMCLAGMLASDALTLPEIVLVEVRIFFSYLEDWLEKLLVKGVEAREFLIDKTDVKDEAMLIVSLLEGVLLQARVFKNKKRLFTIKNRVIQHLKEK